MKISWKYVLVALLALLLVVLGAWKFLLPMAQQRTISLNDYMTVEFEGTSKYATATATFQDYNFRQDFEKKYGNDACDAIAALADHVTFSPSENLTNGDVVTLHWDTENAATIAEQYGMTLDATDATYTVTGLSKADEFYPFYGLDVEFSGINGNGEAILDGDPEGDAASLRFVIEPATGLYNGDVVRLVAQAPDGSDLDTYCMTHFGKLPSDDYKDFTVSRLDANLTALNQLPDGEILSLAARAQSRYEESIASRYADGQTYLGMQLNAATLLVNESETNRSVDNYLILTFWVDVHNSHVYDTGEVYDADNFFYWNIVYRDLDVGSDNTLTADFDTPRVYANGLTHIYAITPSNGNTIRWDNDGYDTLEDALEAASDIATHFTLADVIRY